MWSRSHTSERPITKLYQPRSDVHDIIERKKRNNKKQWKSYGRKKTRRFVRRLTKTTVQFTDFSRSIDPYRYMQASYTQKVGYDLQKKSTATAQIAATLGIITQMAPREFKVIGYSGPQWMSLTSHQDTSVSGENTSNCMGPLWPALMECKIICVYASSCVLSKKCKTIWERYMQRRKSEAKIGVLQYFVSQSVDRLWKFVSM